MHRRVPAIGSRRREDLDPAFEGASPLPSAVDHGGPQGDVARDGSPVCRITKRPVLCELPRIKPRCYENEIAQ